MSRLSARSGVNLDGEIHAEELLRVSDAGQHEQPVGPDPGHAQVVDEAADIAYPVYAKGATPLTARRRTQEHAWNIPVEIAGVTVNPGDLIVADATGIIVIPAEHAEPVIATAVGIVAKEAAMAADIAAGVPVSTVMGTNYEHLGADTSETA